MRKVSVNIVLIITFILLLVVITLPFVAEVEFERAKELEANYQWKKAERIYQRILALNPFNAEHFVEVGNFLMRQGKYHKEKLTWFKRAEQLYTQACKLNPSYGEHWYRLGQAQLVISRQSLVNSKEKKVEFNSSIETFKEAIKKEPYNLRINYLVGYRMLTDWKSLNAGQRDFALDRLKYVLTIQPWYGSPIYSGIMYYTKDFSIAEKVTPDNLEGNKALLSFIEENNLWKHREKVKKRMDFYQPKEKLKEFEQERLARIEHLKEIKGKYRNKVEVDRNEIEMNGNTLKLIDWQGKSWDGESSYEGGNMYWKGTIDKAINMPKGETLVKIKAKGTSANDIYPYMIVELNGEEIGETFVDSSEWKEYSFSVNTDGGVKVLSVTFANDGGNEEKREDRNLYVGEARVIKNE